jgi:hypothetical protein
MRYRAHPNVLATGLSICLFFVIYLDLSGFLSTHLVFGSHFQEVYP